MNADKNPQIPTTISTDPQAASQTPSNELPSLQDESAHFFSGAAAMAEPERAPAHTIITHEQGPLDWTASAAVTAGGKSKTWYGGLVASSVIVAAIVYFISKDVVSGVAIIIAALLFGAISTKKPRDLHYALDQTGITIGQKHFVFNQFRSFSIVDDGGYTSIALMPLKRFAPLITVAYDPLLHDQIVSALSAYLPLEEYKRDALDHITSRFNF